MGALLLHKLFCLLNFFLNSIALVFLCALSVDSWVAGGPAGGWLLMVARALPEGGRGRGGEDEDETKRLGPCRKVVCEAWTHLSVTSLRRGPPQI